MIGKTFTTFCSLAFITGLTLISPDSLEKIFNDQSPDSEAIIKTK